jgi:hypothetical protein
MWLELLLSYNNKRHFIQGSLQSRLRQHFRSREALCLNSVPLELASAINTIKMLSTVSTMAPKNCTRESDPTNPANGQQDIVVQAALSLALGVSAFLGFCVIPPPSSRFPESEADRM